jgi:hypothetical protein
MYSLTMLRLREGNDGPALGLSREEKNIRKRAWKSLANDVIVAGILCSTTRNLTYISANRP